MKRILPVIGAATLVLFIVVLFSGGNADGPYVQIAGPRLNSDLVAIVTKQDTPKSQVIELIGEPIFTFNGSDNKNQILIFRELRQRISVTYKLFRLVETEKYYRSFEEILLLEIIEDRVSAHKLLSRSYPKPAAEVEFGLDESLPEFIRSK